MKIGDRVRIKQGVLRGAGLEGVLRTTTRSMGECVFGVDFGRVLEFTHTLRGILPTQTGRWYFKYQLEVIDQPSESTTTQLQTYYKAFRVVDGELKSLIKWSRAVTDSRTKKAVPKPTLSYKEGDITYNPEGQVGLFLYDNLNLACRRAGEESGGEQHVVVHEVTALGNATSYSWCWADYIVCPAVLVGKKVWEFNAPPKMGWVDVTKQCTPGIYPRSYGGYLVGIHHNGKLLLSLGKSAYKELEAQRDYRVTIIDNGTQGGFKVEHWQEVKA